MVTTIMELKQIRGGALARTDDGMTLSLHIISFVIGTVRRRKYRVFTDHDQVMIDFLFFLGFLLHPS